MTRPSIRYGAPGPDPSGERPAEPVKDGRLAIRLAGERPAVPEEAVHGEAPEESGPPETLEVSVDQRALAENISPVPAAAGHGARESLAEDPYPVPAAAPEPGGRELPAEGSCPVPAMAPGPGARESPAERPCPVPAMAPGPGARESLAESPCPGLVVLAVPVAAAAAVQGPQAAAAGEPGLPEADRHPAAEGSV